VGSASLMRSVMRLKSRVAPCVVATACFSLLLLVLALGVLALPMWVSMLVAKIAQPERFAVDEPIWPIVLSIIEVLSGVAGILGLLRTLALLRKRAAVQSRRLTGLMVATGLVGLSVFNWVVFIPGIFTDDDVPWMALAVYVALPYLGAACLVYATRDELFGAWRSSADVVPSA
jgi:hypothetical protein